MVSSSLRFGGDRESRFDVAGFQPVQNETDRRVRGCILPIDRKGLVRRLPMNPDERADAKPLDI